MVGGYEVDFHWPDAKLILETDSRQTHAAAIALERDRRRDLDLKLAGRLRREPDRLVALLRMKLRGL